MFIVQSGNVASLVIFNVVGSAGFRKSSLYEINVLVAMLEKNNLVGNVDGKFS